MFNDDEDYSFLTGGLGDLDGDGRVDFVEYMNEGLKQLEGDYWDLKEIFLGIYANSVNNVLKLN